MFGNIVSDQAHAVDSVDASFGRFVGVPDLHGCAVDRIRWRRRFRPDQSSARSAVDGDVAADDDGDGTPPGGGGLGPR